MKESEATAMAALVLAIPAIAMLARSLATNPVAEDVVRNPAVRDAWGEVVDPVKNAVWVTFTACCESLERRRCPGLSAAS